MLSLRLTRRGKKNQAFYRLVVAEKGRPIKGRFIEILGFLNPYTKEIKLKKKRIQYWLSVGAQTSATVHNLLLTHKIIKGQKINKFKKHRKKEQTKVSETKQKDAKKTDKETVQKVQPDTPQKQPNKNNKKEPR